MSQSLVDCCSYCTSRTFTLETPMPFNYIRTSKSFTLAIAAGIALAWTTASAIGDTIVMRDGTTYNGTIVSESRRSIVIETSIHGIKTRMTLNARDVRSIERTPEGTVDDDAPQHTPSTDSTLSIPKASANSNEDAIPLKREGYNLLMEVPIAGGFGTDIYPLSVANSLKWAKENGVTDVIFRINSGGGAIWCSNDIVTLIKEYDDADFKMHMLIESAISASIWPSFACDTITMTPGSDFGGAVVYSMNSTGSAEVDMKMNGIRAAKLESTADAKGHQVLLVKAMTISHAAMYAYQEEPDGPWLFSNSTDDLPEGYETIDGPDEVLTLTAKDALKYGLVTSMPEGKSLEEFAEVHGIEKWDSVGDIGHTIAKRDNKRSKAFQKRLDATIQSFYTNINQFGNSNRIMNAGSALQSAKKSIGVYKRLMKQAQDMSMPSIIDSYDNAIDVIYWEQQIKDYQADLRRYKRMGP